MSHKPMWNFSEAVDLISGLQQFAHDNGYHMGLAGGVLNKGSSNKDLDIMIMPLNDEKLIVTRNIDAVIGAIGDKINCQTRKDYAGEYGNRIVTMDLVILMGDKKRIDIFITKE